MHMHAVQFPLSDNSQLIQKHVYLSYIMYRSDTVMLHALSSLQAYDCDVPSKIWLSLPGILCVHFLPPSLGVPPSRSPLTAVLTIDEQFHFRLKLKSLP